jgi:hypothetical protein
MRTVNRIVYAVIFCCGIFAMLQGHRWGLVLDNKPGPGFVPFWVGVLIVIASVWPFVLTFLGEKGNEPQPFTKRDVFYFAVIIGGGVFVAIFSRIIGMMVSIGIMTAAITRLLGTKKLTVTLAVSVGMPVIIYLLFVLLLDVPLPKNLIGLI